MGTKGDGAATERVPLKGNLVLATEMEGILGISKTAPRLLGRESRGALLEKGL